MDDEHGGELIYGNPLAGPADVAGWRLEGEASITFPNGRMRIENLRDPGEGQSANLVFWCPEDFPDGIEITWDFWPVRETLPGYRALTGALFGLMNVWLAFPYLETSMQETVEALRVKIDQAEEHLALLSGD